MADKMEIRRVFHKQLKSLWTQQPLSEHQKLIDESFIGQPSETTLLAPQRNFLFAPLVSGKHGWNTIATLDILFLRPSEPGNMINHGGDLDNRIKTLFDALRMPSDQELPASAIPNADENPFFVLLEDDCLVTSFSVQTDRLLDGATDKSQVYLVVEVNVQTTRTSWLNVGI